MLPDPTTMPQKKPSTDVSTNPVWITKASSLAWLLNLKVPTTNKLKRSTAAALMKLRVTRVTRMAYSPSLWLMAIGW
jgi:hypothetical protein